MSNAPAAIAETTLKVSLHSDLKIVDPVWTTALISTHHGMMIYDTLFALDRNLEVQPQMVDRRGHCWIIDFGLVGYLSPRGDVSASHPLAGDQTCRLAAVRGHDIELPAVLRGTVADEDDLLTVGRERRQRVERG